MSYPTREQPIPTYYKKIPDEISTLGVAANATPDGIDRIKELLNSAIDQGYHQVERVRRAIDRVAGPHPEESSTPSAPYPPMPEQSVYFLLGRLCDMQSAMNRQLDRLREQMP